MRTRYFFGLAALSLAVVLVTSPAQADIFFSGRADVNGSIVGGNDVTGAREFSLDTGFGYTNNWGINPIGGAPGVGAKVTGIGFVTFSTATAGNTIDSLGVGTDLIGVYAFQGSQIATAGGELRASFDPSVGGFGTVAVFDRSSLGMGITSNDPTTWVSGVGGVLSGLVNLNTITDRADAYFAGPPGGNQTSQPSVIDPNLVNTAAIDPTGAVLRQIADFKTFIDDPGTFLSNLDIVNSLDPDLFATLEQVLQLTPEANEQLPTSIADLNDLFDQLMQLGGFAAGLDFAAIGTGDNQELQLGNGIGQIAATGDNATLNDGGNVIPGSQVAPPEIPEPASVLAWSLVIGIGALVGIRRRRRRTA